MAAGAVVVVRIADALGRCLPLTDAAGTGVAEADALAAGAAADADAVGSAAAGVATAAATDVTADGSGAGGDVFVVAADLPFAIEYTTSPAPTVPRSAIAATMKRTGRPAARGGSE